MSNAEAKTVTVALNCSVNVSGTVYAPDDVIRVPGDIAQRLIEQKVADLYEVPAEDEAVPPAEEDTQPDGSDEDDENPGEGEESDSDAEEEKRAKGRKGGKPKADVED